MGDSGSLGMMRNLDLEGDAGQQHRHRLADGGPLLGTANPGNAPSPSRTSCANCDGRKCMGCVLREYGHDCANDCPFCCSATGEGQS